MHKSSEHSDKDYVWNEDAPTVISCAHFEDKRGLWPSSPQALFVFRRPMPGRKGMQMKLKIRFENKYQTLDVGADEMWVSLSLEGSEYSSEKEKEKLIQDAFDKQFNRPEYNCWHKFNRHIDPNPRPRRLDGKRGHLSLEDENGQSMNAEDSLFVDDHDKTESNLRYEYEDVCQLVHKALGKKQDWIDMFIAVRIDGIPIRDYARSIGADENNISQKLKRAEKKIKEFLENHQI
ncbi:sigma-70 family RNA polymerase sigma factor [Anaerorhabdus sp.]|uniref:sigma-70 family RNA polymerase sigma factor n=1 Tax=Anaerorhabdus sp. TaxID=1872524 RepID=UPI002B1EC994|nr:sigma-70 family RNA polymerase sigma factor [Anaerorhabdus sp.]MEA4874373.1 sigma-70 family RNA polymerase sigma factor [Anaerorhabdus sp.]